MQGPGPVEANSPRTMSQLSDPPANGSAAFPLSNGALGGALPREPKQERSRAKRRALLDAAEQLFATRGFDAVSAEDIAAEAGYAPATFYNYFANKAQVFVLVAERHWDAVAPVLSPVAGAASEGGDLRSVVRAAAMHIMRRRLEVPWLRRTWLRLALEHPQIAEADRTAVAEWDRAFADVLRAGAEARMIVVRDPEAVAVVVRVLFDAVIDEVVVWENLDPERAVDACVDLLLRAIERAAEAAGDIAAAPEAGTADTPA